MDQSQHGSRTQADADGNRRGEAGADGARGHKRRLMDGKDHLNATRDSS